MVRLATLSVFLALLALLAGPAASAHQGATTGYAALDIAGHALRYNLTLSQLPAPLLAAAGGDAVAAQQLLPGVLGKGLKVANGGEPCAMAAVQLTPAAVGKESVTLVADWVCRLPVSTLTLRDDTFEELGGDLHTLARITWAGGSSQFAFASEARETQLHIADPVPVATGIERFFKLGLWHILGGYDHFLFLLALLLAPASGWAILRIITAFTLAHSVTLVLSALQLLQLPSALVEATIAAAIAYVAGENVFRRQPGRHRMVVTLILGLVHGSGFAGILRPLGLSQDHRVAALLGVNLGVEAGQIWVVAALLPVLRWVIRQPRGQAVTQGMSALLCLGGLCLLWSRVLAG